MPVDDIYWNPVDFGSNETLHDLPPSKHHLDPWDLENYVYIKEQLDLDDSSDPISSGEFIESNSTSFYYVPGNPKPVTEVKNKAQIPNDSHYQKFDSFMTEQGNYAAIDEVKVYDRKRPSSDLTYEVNNRRHMLKRMDDFDTELEENPYEYGLGRDSSSLYVYDSRDKSRRHAVPHARKSARDRSLSFSYGDHAHSADSYRTKNELYSRVPELPENDSFSPLYDDIKSMRRKPNNFGLSNYGHLKIDYSYSWNNLYKIMSS